MDHNVAALTVYPGTYEKKLFSTLINALKASLHATIVPGVKYKMNMTKLKVQAGAKPYSNDFTGSTSDLTYTPRVLEVETGKRELQIDVEEFRTTYLSEVMSAGVDPKDLPFAAYVWTEVMKALAAEINDSTAYLGVGQSGVTTWASGTAYAVGDKVRFGNDYFICNTITTAGQSPTTHAAKWTAANAKMIAKGWGTIIAEEITGGGLTVTSIGSIADSTAKAQFDDFARAMDPAYQEAGFNIYCSVNNAWKYNDDYEDKVGKYVQLNKNGFATLSGFGDRVQVIPATWMGNSGRLIATPKENLLMGVDALSDLNKINVFPSDWTIKVGMAFRIGFQFRDLAAMKISDVA
jgi:hypothetical protein